MSPRAIAAAAIVALIGSLVIWALLERSGRLSCAARAAELEAAYGVLADAAKRQSAAVAELEAKADAARDKGRQATIVATTEAKPQQAIVDAVALRLAAPTPTGKGCREALAEIRSAL